MNFKDMAWKIKNIGRSRGEIIGNIWELNDFKELSDIFPVCIKVLSGDKKILFINAYGKDEHFLENKSAKEIKDWNYLDSIAVKDRERIEKAIEDAFVGKTARLEFDHVADNAKNLYELGIISPIGNRGDGVGGVLFISVDNTNRKLAELAMQQSQRFISSVFGVIGALVVAMDINGKILFFNQECERLTGYKSDEVKGKPLWDIFLLPEEKETTQKVFGELAAGQLFNKHENYWITKSGERRLISWSNTILTDDGGKVLNVIGTGIDITEERARERKLEIAGKELTDAQKALMNLLEDIEMEKNVSEARARELQKFQLAVENTSDHVVITDQDGVILYANPAAEIMTGYSRSELIGKRPSLFGNQMSKEFYRMMWKIIKEDKTTFTGDITNKRKHGEIYMVEAHISPIIDKNGKVIFFVGIERDITAEREVERVKSDFISLASHQLRTPLTSIKWISDLFLSGDLGELNSKQQEFMGDLYTSTNRMIDLINSLLNIARIESAQLEVKVEPIEIGKIYDDLKNELSQFIGKHKHDVTFEKAPDIPSLETDGVILYEILKNLLTNSIKYTPNGGKISISTSLKDDSVFFVVKDNGYGIPANQQLRVFQRFFRGDNIVKIDTTGTGLGMYIVKSLVGLLKGEISFESRENRGTTFYVTLPLRGLAGRKGTKELEKGIEL